MTKLYGLIGNPLSHSFSKEYFENKFDNEKLIGCIYNLYEIKEVELVLEVIKQNPSLLGLNVTIPYKEAIIPLLDSLDESALGIGAVNVIKIIENKLIGFNSDYYGFEKSLLKWLPDELSGLNALILGSGGAAKAVKAVLIKNNIGYTTVSRKSSMNSITYLDLKESNLIGENKLLINTTPVGMSPKVNECPDLAYNQLTSSHFAYDLIYNPSKSRFLKKAYAQGAHIKNGLEMLELQAEKSWEIWSS